MSDTKSIKGTCDLCGDIDVDVVVLDDDKLKLFINACKDCIAYAQELCRGLQ